MIGTPASDEIKADVPPFMVGGVEFNCFVAINRDGTPYVWRSSCMRLAVGRVGHTIWARVDGRLIGRQFGSLSMAMSIAALELAKERVAA